MNDRMPCFLTRFIVAAAAGAAALLPATGVAIAQSPGAVLTASDIWSEHPFQRPVEVEGRAWLALVVDDGRSRLEPVEARWTGSVFFEDSIFQLSLTPQLSPSAVPHLLLADVPAVRAGPATTVLEDEASLWADQRRLEIALGGAAYELQLHASDPMLCDATVTVAHGNTIQTLYRTGDHAFSCDEPHFSVQWAGDLDGDGRLDLVTTFSPKYSYYPRRLYLSSAAAPGELVGLVAVLELAAA